MRLFDKNPFKLPSSIVLFYSGGAGNVNPLQYSCLENSMDVPGRLQSMGSQRVAHDWEGARMLTRAHTHTHILVSSLPCVVLSSQ